MCFCAVSVFQAVTGPCFNHLIFLEVSLETGRLWLLDFLGGVPWETDTENRTWRGGRGAKLGRGEPS